MIKLKTVISIVAAMLIGVSSTGAMALGHSGGGGLGGMLGGGGGDKVDFAAAESEVVGLINGSLKNLATAQAKILGALGLKEDAAVAEQNAKDLESGSLTGKDEMASKIDSSKALNDKIVAKLSEKQALDAGAKAEFGKSLLPYAKGVITGVQGGKKAMETFKSLSANPMQLTKFGTLAYVGKEAPGLISNFVDATKAIKDFATFQGIPTDDLAEASGL